jgi:predicted ABC-type ATPase
MFAGPNGSGKTTVKNELNKPTEWYGLYFNPDELEKQIRSTASLSLKPFGLRVSTDDVRNYFAASKLLARHGLESAAESIVCVDDEIIFHGIEFNSYYASTLTSLLRTLALRTRKSFSFETVMSDRDKVDVLRDAQAEGYRTYLYYVATEDPEINKQRVRNRVADGGHPVPEEKIESRYHRSLALLTDAIRFTNRAYLFDTSETRSSWFAEITDGSALRFLMPQIPVWFERHRHQFTLVK